jgi:FlaA1/EpsC-like NDP-sugar epimerase
LLDTANPDKTILVTGAGGCIGSALTRSLLSNGAHFLILLDHSEQNLHELNRQFADVGASGYAAILGDILDGALLGEIFERYRPNTIYHAAAFKHVPLMESNPIAVIRNNAIGTWELAKCAIRFQARRLLLISTDKAVNPRSVMGASKRIAEMVFQGMSNGTTKMNALRLGNVLDSQGSVGPLFREQIKRGGPVTVTHPDARRFFLTIGETVELILAAAALDDSGRIFVPKMREPVKIVDLAARMIQEAGVHTPRDIQISFTGLRPGDKLEEELVSALASLEPTSDDRLRRVKSLPVNVMELDGSLCRISESVAERDLAALLGEVSKLVPEYRPSETLLGLLKPSLA